MVKILITGGAGFIGSHITDLLIEKGYKVIVVDNLSTGNKENINPKAVFYKADLRELEKLKEVFEKEKPDFVIHEAAQVNVRASTENPKYDADVNIIGAVNMLECCHLFGIKKALYSSSGGAIYGEPEYVPCDEKHPIKPICHYGASKYAVELYLGLYKRLYGLNYIALRYANVYGPRQDPKGEAGVISIFSDKFLKGEIPKIFGDGEQTRDYVYVKDVAKANLLALESDTKINAFNIGTGKKTSVNELCSELKEKFRSSIKAEHTDAIPAEVRHIFLNTELAKKELGWQAEVELKEGLKKTARWFRNG